MSVGQPVPWPSIPESDHVSLHLILRLGIVNRNTSTFGVISVKQQPADQRCSESRYRPCGTRLRVCCLGVVPGWVYGGSDCSPGGHRGACERRGTGVRRERLLW